MSLVSDLLAKYEATAAGRRGIYSRQSPTLHASDYAWRSRNRMMHRKILPHSAPLNPRPKAGE